MKYIINFLKKNWPIVTYFTITLILFFINYKPGTFLTGWDNLHPEFNPLLNIKRSIFAVWQEYQGLGLLGGMGHASDLARQVFILLLTIVIPENQVRYILTFLTLFLGAFGTYKLVSFITEKEGEDKLLPFLAGLFYMLNLSTIQTYYVAFEAFTAHFAALPWLIYGSLMFFKKPSYRNLSIFTGILFLSTPSAYIPTLYVVFLFAITILITTLVIVKAGSFKNAIKTYLVIFTVNAFWLLPFTYFTLTTSSVNLSSKINLMATPNIYARNREFGEPLKVLSLQGFLLNTIEPNLKGQMNYVAPVWREHLNKGEVNVAIYITIGLILLGIFSSIKNGKNFFMSSEKSKNYYPLAFTLVFIFAFTLLATESFPFSFINATLRNSFPILNQAFRFPFTKLSILASLTYSIFFAYGITFLIKKFDRKKLIITAVFLLITVITAPLFRGQMFYERGRIDIPKKYFDLFKYLKTQDKNTRIANLPQQTFWGWEYFDWGYGGSGFMWYSIPQTVLDRAFDVWSKESENYYYELTNAIYSKNAEQLENVLNKYQINFVIIDKSIISSFAPKSLFIDETHGILTHIGGVKKIAEFENLELYKVDLKDKPKNFTFGTNSLPKINSYTWTNFDQAHLVFGNYINEGNDYNYAFPFRSLFSNRTQNDLAYKIKNTPQNIQISQKIQLASGKQTVKISNYTETQEYIPVSFYVKREGKSMVVNMKVTTPQIYVNNKKIYGESFSTDLFIVPDDSSNIFTLDVNGIKKYKVSNIEGSLGTTSLSTNTENFITITDSSGESANQIINKDFLASLPIFKPKSIGIEGGGEVNFKVIIPKIDDNKSSHYKDTFSLKKCDLTKSGITKLGQKNKETSIYSAGTTACLYTLAPDLIHNNSYAVFVESKNIQGNPLHFWVLNEDEKWAPIDTVVKKSSDFSTSSFILPTMEKYGRGYSFQIENASVGNHPSENVIRKISAYPIPSEFVSLITIINKHPNIKQSDVKFTTDHPNESLYWIRDIIIKNHDPFTVVLSQSYDNGWVAYKVSGSRSKIKKSLNLYLPFLFGTKIKDHFKVNNWENGWTIEPNKLAKDTDEPQIVIVYLPQYLEYLGFASLVGMFGYILVKKVQKENYSV